MPLRDDVTGGTDGLDDGEGTPCPRCGTGRLRPILYGFPTPAAFEAADRGDLVLGGCVISDHDPMTACPTCGARFGDRSRVPTTQTGDG